MHNHLKNFFLPPRKEAFSIDSHRGKFALQAPSHFGNALCICGNALCSLRGS